jgi:hypothetical protein
MVQRGFLCLVGALQLQWRRKLRACGAVSAKRARITRGGSPNRLFALKDDFCLRAMQAPGLESFSNVFKLIEVPSYKSRSANPESPSS